MLEVLPLETNGICFKLTTWWTLWTRGEWVGLLREAFFGVGPGVGVGVGVGDGQLGHGVAGTPLLSAL